MIIPRLIIKAKKVDGGPTPGNPHPFPIAVGIFLPLFSLWNNPAHTLQLPFTLGPFSPAEMARTVCGVCISLNKLAFTFLWLTLESSPEWDQGPSGGGPSQGLTCDLGFDPPLAPQFPAALTFLFLPAILVQSFTFSPLDHCISFLVGLPSTGLSQHECTHSDVAKFIFHWHPSGHTSAQKSPVVSHFHPRKAGA